MAAAGEVNQTREQRLMERVSGPSPLTRVSMNKMGEAPLIVDEMRFPKATWTKARFDKRHGQNFPQAIAHRGYKAAFPENTMAAFKGAVEVGAHAIETDIHLSKDGVVLLSHDATLKRCFGRPEKLADLEWKEIGDLQTIAEPKQHMPKLSDLLEYLAKPGLEEVWLLLDIKLDNDANEIMSRIASTIAATTPSTKVAWKDRVVLGIWATRYIPLCAQHLPGFPVSHIGFSPPYAGQFLNVPNVSFNMLQVILVGPLGSWFISKARKAQREIFTWTVNDERNMRWCIKRELDGVISDDPKKFLAICDNWPAEKDKFNWSIQQILNIIRINIMALVFGVIFRRKFGPSIKIRQLNTGNRT